jgi:alpha-beta hydrolase superfamily lysophospholipase
MRPVHLVEITTPKKFALYGLWYGPQKAERVIIIVHGLCSTMFSSVSRELPQHLVDGKTAVLVFNNRGHDIVSKISSAKKTLLAGGAHENFKESADDLRGAVLFAKKNGAKFIFLAGHSTGCQKAVYYVHVFKKDPIVKGLILLAPVSDHSAALKTDKSQKLRKAVAVAQKMVKVGKKNELMPKEFLTPWSINDAQRFLSLYTPDSTETLFPYEQTGKKAKVLSSIKIPILVMWAGKDQYADRPSKEIARWFDANITGNHHVHIVPNVKHGFNGGEKMVATLIKARIG